MTVRNISMMVIGILTASIGSAVAADTVLTYRGKLLRPYTGSGVPRVKNLHFTVSGHVPAHGKCRSDFKIISVSDGAYSLKDALAHGFIPSPDNEVRICSDAKTGALSELLRVNVASFSYGNLVASYTWLSSNPRRGRAADTVIDFANIEYHVSLARRPGNWVIGASDR